MDFDALSVEEKRELLDSVNMRLLEESQGRYLSFIQALDPSFCRSKHHEIIAEHLEAVERGDITRLMIFMPPRSSKSLMVSQYYPPWYLGKHPNHQVMAISYNIELAEKFGRFVRNVIQSPEYKQIFTKTSISKDARAAARWQTTEGGEYNAAGVTGGIAGRGWNLGLIDDPLNEQDAYSKPSREHVLQWYPAGFRSRQMPGGKVILLMTRWHDQDLAGHLLQESLSDPGKDQWTVIKIPALLDKVSSKLLSLPENTTYWPQHMDPPETSLLYGWTTEEVKQTKANMPPGQWQALYMQNPVVEGGNILKNIYWKRWNKKDPPECNYVFMSMDTAFSTKDSADFSVITTWGVFTRTNEAKKKQNCLMLLGAKRGRWDFPKLRKETLISYEYHKPDAIVIEKKASGQSLIQELTQAGLPVMPFQPDKDKEARAHACVPMFYQGLIWAPNKEWAEPLIEECARFPASPNDDFVDATTQAVRWVRDAMLIFGTDEPWEHIDEDSEGWSRKRQKLYS